MSTPEPQTDNVPVLLPVLEEPLPPDQTFELWEEGLGAPAGDDLVVVADRIAPVGRGWAFDFVAHRTVIGPEGHGPLVTRDVATLRVWVEHTLRVARGAHAIYTDDYGIDLPGDLFGGPVEHFPSDEYENEVREALIQHPDIADVTDYTAGFNPDEEFVVVSFTVVRRTGEAFVVANVRLGA